MDVIHECRMILAAAKPANGNAAPLRLAPQERVDLLLSQLNAQKPRATVYLQPEATPAGLRPAPWLIRQVERAG